MRVSFLVENIENFLPTLSKILPIHPQIQVLANILIEATKEGLSISSTNLELGVKIKIPAKIDEEGATTIPGKQFIEAITSLPKDKIEVFKEGESLILKSRQNRVLFQTISKDEFPALFSEKGEKIHIFEKKEMESIFSKILFSVSQEDSRPELTGILISQKDEGIDFVATDGFRLSVKKITGKKILDENGNMIFPARLINEVLAIKTNEKITMYVHKKTSQIIFETGDIIFVGRLINGEFPNYERVLPKSYKTKIVCDKEEFIQELKLSSIFARESANIIKVKISEGQIKIFSKTSGLGEGEAVLEGEQDGEDNEIAFNVKFISDVLKNIPDKNITMELSSSIEPAVFKTEEDPEFVHIIMPVRVQE